MKKFYIVKDETDLLSGGIIPKKVLKYLPPGSLGPFIQPIPIRKSSELVIPISPVGSIGNMSSIFSPAYSPVSVTRSIVPLAPLTNGCSSVIASPMSPCGSNYSFLPSPAPPSIVTGNIPRFGPPIIKYSPMINQGVGGLIKIISANSIYTINVPIRYMRAVVNDIYLNSQVNLSPLAPKVMFRIITPTIDSSLQTTPERMIAIIKYINNKYSGLHYLRDDGSKLALGVLLELLMKNYKL